MISYFTNAVRLFIEYDVLSSFFGVMVVAFSLRVGTLIFSSEVDY